MALQWNPYTSEYEDDGQGSGYEGSIAEQTAAAQAGALAYTQGTGPYPDQPHDPDYWAPPPTANVDVDDPAQPPTGGPPPPPPPPPPPGPGPTNSGSGGGGGSIAPTFGNPYQFPTFTAPQFNAPAPFEAPPAFSFDAYQAPTPFSYESFNAPTLEQAQSEPGYEFARREGQRALENSAAAKGTLRTGGTLKDLLGWGNKFAEQNYGNVYNRAANTYGTNRQNAFDTYQTNEGHRANAYDRNRGNALDQYKTNYGVQAETYDRNFGRAKDTFDREFSGKLAEFNPVFQGAQLNFDDAYRRWQAQLNSLTSIASAGAGL